MTSGLTEGSDELAQSGVEHARRHHEDDPDGGYRPYSPTHRTFQVDGKVDLKQYARYLRFYRITASALGMALGPIVPAKKKPTHSRLRIAAA